MHVSTPPKWSKHIHLCLRNLQKIGTWGANRSWDIDLPTSTCICSIQPSIGHQYSDQRYVNISQVVLKCFYVPQELPNKMWCIGPLQKLRYWPPHSPMYLLNLAQLWTLVLFTQVCQHLPSGLKFPMCHRNFQEIGTWGPNRSLDIDLPTPTCICSTQPRFGYWHSAHKCVNTSQAVYKCFYVSQEPPKFGACKHNVKWHTTQYQRCPHLTP